MNKIYPQKLQKGDIIRVIAPSRSLGIISEETRANANKIFKKIGLRLEFSKHSHEIDDFKSSSIESRISDIHDAFRNPEVKAVLSVIGGFNSNQLLKYIDWDIIKANPKIFCGYSDITVLNNAIFAKTGLVNYSGPAYSTFGKLRDMEYTIEYFKKCLFSDNPIEIEASEKWDDRKWWINQDDGEFFKNPKWQIINEGETKGTIIGGNLGTLNLLQGTDYFPSLENTILFIEDDYETYAEMFDRDLQSLIHQKGFNEVKGLVIGRFQIASKISESKLKQIIKSKNELDKIPVVAGVDFGHTDPKITFPIGGEVEVSAYEHKSSINIIKH
ncbi:MAG: Microcin C7 self-immunity protein MccF [candidate division WS2 bacterium ADurb.Bin280]|uniref:Microcin C7 self-immunity protein MccF n=1 Tax=candidate division WS2 bacterium ADurb.Bin280 TaxID=1852829 RepID=A0A1V5SFE1_9BACT|nr:MAG: Microcin C7 self-immunity protein MccF [candidate division WS2 bacterium ADurb.Bin280]